MLPNSEESQIFPGWKVKTSSQDVYRRNGIEIHLGFNEAKVVKPDGTWKAYPSLLEAVASVDERVDFLPYGREIL